MFVTVTDSSIGPLPSATTQAPANYPRSRYKMVSSGSGRVGGPYRKAAR